MAEYLDYEGLREYTELIRKYTQPWIATGIAGSSSSNNCIHFGAPEKTSTQAIISDYFKLAKSDPNFCAPLVFRLEYANLSEQVSTIAIDYDIYDDCGHLIDWYSERIPVNIHFDTRFDDNNSSGLSGTFVLYRYDTYNRWDAVGCGTQLYPDEVTLLKTTLSELHSGGIN